MNQLMTVIDIFHLDVDGSCLWELHNLKNTFHRGGEEFLLKTCFNTASSVTVPSNYYLGLDDRDAIAVDDTFSSLVNEPSTNGYSRKAVSSANGFTVELDDDSNYKATSVVVTFQATGGSWGPVSNLFLATTSDNSGYLLASSSMLFSRTLTSGQILTVRIAVGLRNC